MRWFLAAIMAATPLLSTFSALERYTGVTQAVGAGAEEEKCRFVAASLRTVDGAHCLMFCVEEAPVWLGEWHQSLLHEAAKMHRIPTPYTERSISDKRQVVDVLLDECSAQQSKTY